jgi:DNA (cytosine-5)-methyltransferase 1
VGGIDACPTATATYQENFPNALVLNERLENVSLPQLRRHIGDIDILLSSPECTNHTCAKGAAPRSEKSRATALLAIEYARVFKPRWIVLENVVHMRPWPGYGTLKHELRELGYNLAEQILDASHFGVAQTRRRLFLVGDRRREPRTVDWKARGRPRSARSILDQAGKWPTTPLYRKDRAPDTLMRAKRAISALGRGVPFILVYYGSDGSGGWQPLTRPLRTITTIDRFALVEPGGVGLEMRMLQVPELRRAMGFEETFSFSHGTRRDRIRLLGNGVCPPVMAAVVKTLIGKQV